MPVNDWKWILSRRFLVFGTGKSHTRSYQESSMNITTLSFTLSFAKNRFIKSTMWEGASSLFKSQFYEYKFCFSRQKTCHKLSDKLRQDVLFILVWRNKFIRRTSFDMTEVYISARIWALILTLPLTPVSNFP